MTHLEEIAMVQSRRPPRTAQAAYFVTPIPVVASNSHRAIASGPTQESGANRGGLSETSSQCPHFLSTA